MNIITIGDLHGCNDWENFEDIKNLIENPNLTPKYDYYVFVGDYTDSFVKSDAEILHNLKRLIQFKDNHPNNVILLYGNHEIHYLFEDYSNYLCSGFRGGAYYELHEFFKKNKNKFQFSFQIENYLFTHAGIEENWYHTEYPYTSLPISESLNKAFQDNEKSLFNVGKLRGGMNEVGGPLWLDKQKSELNPLKGYHQVVGHTPVDDIITVSIDTNTSITYCDCIERGSGNYYILNIEKDLWPPVNYDKIEITYQKRIKI